LIQRGSADIPSEIAAAFARQPELNSMLDLEHLPPTPGCVAAILPAAGSGARFGANRNKLFATLAGQPLWFHAASRLRNHPWVGPIVMAIATDDQAIFSGEYAPLIESLQIQLVIGGAERTDSVLAGLDAVTGDPAIRFVAIHDAARPLVSKADVSSVCVVAAQTGAAILATPISGTVKRDLENQARCETVDRRELWLALTPQVFSVGLLKAAYSKHNGRPATDDAELVERLGRKISLVRGSADNLKITYPEDLLIAEAILARSTNQAFQQHRTHDEH
jgi:2-C-methyl-D-erythritol 4-phosphate cytidylyltransferase